MKNNEAIEKKLNASEHVHEKRPGFCESFRKEFYEEACMHKRRVIKMLGLSIVPFLYIFICIWAFWNPFMQIEKIPAAIMDYETKQTWHLKVDPMGAINPTESSLSKIYFSSIPASKKHNPSTYFDRYYDNTTLANAAVEPMITDPINKIIHFEKSPDSMVKTNLKYLATQKQNDDELNDQYWVQLRVPTTYGDDMARVITNLMQYYPIYKIETGDNKPADIDLLNRSYFAALQNNMNVLLGRTVGPVDSDVAAGHYYKEVFKGPQAGDYQNHALSFWSTYRNNYLSGYFMQIFSGMMDGLIKDMAPSMIENVATGSIKLSSTEIDSAGNQDVNNSKIWLDYVKYQEVFTSAKNDYIFPVPISPLFYGLSLAANSDIVKGTMPELADFVNSVDYNQAQGKKDVDALFTKKGIAISYLPDPPNTGPSLKDSGQMVESAVIERSEFLNLSHNRFMNGIYSTDLDNLIQKQIQGEQFNEYGIGLGEFFICIGSYVGTLVQTIVLDRKKRLKRTNFVAQYFVKTLLMWMVAVVQITIVALTIYGIGWSQIGSSFGLQYLWMLFTITVFVFIIQGFWFIIRDELLARIAMIVMLIISLTSGWGTFPGFMQNDFFYGLSYIAPYTYSIHGQGDIIYGIATLGANWEYTSDILQNFGILLVYMVAFCGLGLLGIWRNDRVRTYGTISSKKMYQALIELNMTDWIKKPVFNKHHQVKSCHIDYQAIPLHDNSIIKAKIMELNPWTRKRTHWYRDLDERD